MLKRITLPRFRNPHSELKFNEAVKNTSINELNTSINAF